MGFECKEPNYTENCKIIHSMPCEVVSEFETCISSLHCCTFILWNRLPICDSFSGVIYKIPINSNILLWDDERKKKSLFGPIILFKVLLYAAWCFVVYHISIGCSCVYVYSYTFKAWEINVASYVSFRSKCPVSSCVPCEWDAVCTTW